MIPICSNPCNFPSIMITVPLLNLLFTKQKLDAGIDPPAAFLLSAEAASAGAESTKQMHALVKLCSLPP